MNANEPTIYSAAELKEKLGKYYSAIVLKNTPGASRKEVRNVLAGRGSSTALIMRVMQGAKRALEEKALKAELNARISSPLVG